MRERAVSICGGVIGLGLLMSLGCEPKDAFVMSQLYLITTDVAGPSDLTCTDVASGSGSSGGGTTSDDFWIYEESTPSGLSVRVGSYQEEVATRFYDRSFISARSIDNFVVTSHDGKEYAFVFWGGDSCEPCPPKPVEYYAGAPWSCSGVIADAGPTSVSSSVSADGG
jgi:hypothetical protein